MRVVLLVFLYWHFIFQDRNGTLYYQMENKDYQIFLKFTHGGMKLVKVLKALVNNKSIATHEDFEAKLRNKLKILS